MYIRKAISIFLISLYLLPSVMACSMYKVTADGKTMVGCNEDAWRTTPRIWFLNPTKGHQYGTCFTGSRKVGHNKFAPQSGMNTEGLVFSRLVAYHPKENIDLSSRKTVNNEVDYLTQILQQCKTIDEVKRYIDQFDHSVFIDDVYIYIDQSGDYLVVEPYQLIKGNDPYYVLGNFCPSITSSDQARNQPRYRDGEDYFKSKKIETSLDFCRSASDTMHVCRSRNGDGTLLTSIWDTKEGLVNLHFYHDYNSTKQFNLSTELALGDHIIDITTLFPKNSEFQHLIKYKTPFNVSPLRAYIAILGVFMLFLSLVFFISYFRKRNLDQFSWIKLIFSGLNVLLFLYLFVLATNISIYYFDAPYKHYSSFWISLSSYIPFLLLLIIIPFTFYNIKAFKTSINKKWINSALIFNNTIYIVLILAFAYWGLFNVFH